MKTTAGRIALAAIIALTTLSGATACSSPCPGQEVTIKQVPAKWNGFQSTTKTCPDNAYYGGKERIDALRVDK